MITTLALAAAMTLPQTTFVDTVEAVNAINAESSAPTVMITPPAYTYAESAEEEDIETPIGKVEAISKDIAIIKNAIETGSAIKDAAVDTAVKETPTTWKEWIYLAIGVVIAFLLKLAFSICSRFKAVCSAVNKILKQAEENEAKGE